MNQLKSEQLQQLIDNGYDFRFGEYISRGFDLFKKNIGGFAGFTAVFLLIAFVSNIIPLIGGLAFSLVLSPALVVGYYLVAHKLEKGEVTAFGDFFDGFKHLAPLVLATIVMMVVFLICMAPFFGAFVSIFMGDINALEDFQFPTWALICIIPIIYLGIAWSWAALFIVFYNMPFWDAMEMSRKIITRNWLIIFLFSLVVGFIAGLGMLFFLIGLLFTIPIYYCSIYAAFADVTRLLDEEVDMGIESHLVG